VNPFYLILGGEVALADRTLAKLAAQLKDENAEITTIFAGDALLGDISDALAPSLFS
jgi:DNA polymerase-3 subunit delta